MKGDIFLLDGKPYEHKQFGVFAADVPAETVVPVRTGKPKFEWLGARFPLPLWNQIRSFLRWAYDKHKAEAQVRLFYHETRREWRVGVLPQQVSGGQTKEHATDAERQAILGPLLAEGFQPAGTIHSHGSMSAFQSGTDRADEDQQPGMHVTVGNCNQDTMTLHSRYSYGGQYYELDVADWLEPLNIEEHLLGMTLAMSTQLAVVNIVCEAMRRGPLAPGVTHPVMWEQQVTTVARSAPIVITGGWTRQGSDKEIADKWNKNLAEGRAREKEHRLWAAGFRRAVSEGNFDEPAVLQDVFREDEFVDSLKDLARDHGVMRAFAAGGLEEEAWRKDFESAGNAVLEYYTNLYESLDEDDVSQETSTASDDGDDQEDYRMGYASP